MQLIVSHRKKISLSFLLFILNVSANLSHNKLFTGVEKLIERTFHPFSFHHEHQNEQEKELKQTSDQIISLMVNAGQKPLFLPTINAGLNSNITSSGYIYN